jgi:DNA-binding NtrC family response regulator
MKRILLLEDDTVVRMIAEDALRAAGYQVDVAERRATAQRLIETRLYDLVIADVVLEDGSGLDVADTAAARGLETLVVTGYAPALDAARARNHDVLAKPYDPDALLVATRRHIGV